MKKLIRFKTINGRARFLARGPNCTTIWTENIDKALRFDTEEYAAQWGGASCTTLDITS